MICLFFAVLREGAVCKTEQTAELLQKGVEYSMKHELARRALSVGIASVMVGSMFIPAAALDPLEIYPFDVSEGFILASSYGSYGDDFELKDPDGDGVYSTTVGQSFEPFGAYVATKADMTDNGAMVFWGAKDKTGNSYMTEEYEFPGDMVYDTVIEFDTRKADYHLWSISAYTVKSSALYKDGFKIQVDGDYFDDEGQIMTDPDGDGIYEGYLTLKEDYVQAGRAGVISFTIETNHNPDFFWGQASDGMTLYGQSFEVAPTNNRSAHVFIDTNGDDPYYWTTGYIIDYSKKGYLAGQFGIYGTATDWSGSDDILMSDEDGDGIYTGQFLANGSEMAFQVRTYNSMDAFWGYDSETEGTILYGDYFLTAFDFGYTVNVSFDTRNSNPAKWTVSFSGAFDKNVFLANGVEIYGYDITEEGEEATGKLEDPDHDGVYVGTIKHLSGEGSFHVRLTDDPDHFWGMAARGITFYGENIAYDAYWTDTLRVSFDTNDTDFQKWSISYEIVSRDAVDLYYDSLYVICDSNDWGQRDEYRLMMDMDQENPDRYYYNAGSYPGTREYKITIGAEDDWSYDLNYIWGAEDSTGNCFGASTPNLVFSSSYYEEGRIWIDTSDPDYHNWKTWVEIKKDPVSITKGDTVFNVLGDFNDWTDGALFLKDPDGDGVYTAYVTGLAPRTSQYFEVTTFGNRDNCWSMPDNNGITYNCNSGICSIYSSSADEVYCISFDTRNADYHYWTVTSALAAADDLYAPTPASEFSYEKINNNSAIRITKYNGTRRILHIPETIEGLPVRIIGSNSCSGNNNIRSLYIPSSVITIENNAFWEDQFLDEVILNEGLQTIGYGAFSYVPCSTYMTIPSTVTFIGECAFEGTSIVTLDLKQMSDYTLSQYAFCDSFPLKNIIIRSRTVVFPASGGVFSKMTGESEEVVFPMNMICYPDSTAWDYAANRYNDEYSAEKEIFELHDFLKNDSELKNEFVVKGNAFTVLGKASEGVAPYQFEYSYRKAGASGWTILKNLSKSTYATYKPTLTGTYEFKVKAVDSIGEVEEKVMTGTVVSKLINTSALKESTIVKGSKVTVLPSAKGGVDPYSFEFYYKKTTAESWTRTRITDDGTLAVTFSYSGDYLIKVVAKDLSGQSAEAELPLTVTLPASNLSNTSTINKETVTKGDSFVVTASASGGTAPYTFSCFYRAKDAENWKTVQNDADNASITVTIKYTGTYEIKVTAKDKNGKTADMIFTVTVTSATPLKNVSTISSTSVTKGSRVVITGAATGGTGSYVFTYYYKKSTSEKYNRIGSLNTTETTASFVTGAVAAYNVKVIVMDEAGTKKTKYFTVESTAADTALSNQSFLSADSVKKGTEITITGAASGGTGSYTYQFFVRKSGGKYWTSVPADDNGTFAIYKPASAAAYEVRVIVTDSAGATSELILTFLSLA